MTRPGTALPILAMILMALAMRIHGSEEGFQPPQEADAKPMPGEILALGDSITAGGKGFPSYREYLAPELEKRGLRLVGPLRDRHSAHAGYGGRNSAFLKARIREIYRAHPADIVLVHAGHNHFAKDKPVPGILADTEEIIRIIHRINPQAVVLLAQVIPSGKLPKYAYLPDLNRELAALAKRLTRQGLVTVAVDQAEGFDWRTDTLDDKVHPNAAGARKMARKWLEAILPLLQQGQCRTSAGTSGPVARRTMPARAASLTKGGRAVGMTG